MGRAGRTPAHGRLATRRLRAESCLPPGRPVAVELHVPTSFACDAARKPQIRIKIDGIPGSKSPIGFVESSPARLFREAAQLKTVAAVVRAAGIDVRRVEPQEHAVDAVQIGSGRPAVSAVANIVRRTMKPFAEARGGAARHLNRAAYFPEFLSQEQPPLLSITSVPLSTSNTICLFVTAF